MRPPARLGAVDLGLAGVIVAAGLALRLWCWSGVGLGDDWVFVPYIANLLVSHAVAPGNLSYRFTWWLPTAVAARALGHGEVAMVLPCLIYSLLGIGVVYAFGHLLWGRRGAVTAAALVAAHPLDVVWSTLVTNDFALSFFSLLTMFALLRAMAHEDPVARRRCWTIAAVSLVLAYHSKVSAVGLLPVVAATMAVHRDRLAGARWFLLPAGGLIALAGLVAFALTGSVIGPVRAEVAWQNLLRDPEGHRVTADDLMLFPRLLFRPDQLGDHLNGFYPHALVALAVLGLGLGLRVEPALWWWFAVGLGALVFAVQRVDGYWVTGFRNIRHSHYLAYPLVLLLAGYLSALRARWPRVVAAAAGALVAAALWQARGAATKTQVAFADGRAACEFLATHWPPGAVYLDDVLRTRCTFLIPDALRSWRIVGVPSDAAARRALLGEASDAYVVTGGGREPVYGGGEQAPHAAELPTDRAELILERGGPVDPVWRPEPFRIWRLPPR